MSERPGDFYVTGGAMGAQAASYIPRRADEEAYQALLQGEFCSVLTPSQMGKSSLMARTAARLADAGVSVVRIDLTSIGDNVAAEQWYYTLLLKIGKDLDLKNELRDAWRAHAALGPLRRWTESVRDVVLAHRPGRVVIFIDEIGVVAKLPFSADEFFAAIREFYHRREDDPELDRLTFCLLGVATPSDLLRDPRTTAINIGRQIGLDDFAAAEAAPLAQGLGRDGRLAAQLLERVLHWTGGHPYLTQRLCRAVAEDPDVRGPCGVDRVCRRLFFERGVRGQETNVKEVERQVLHRGPDLAGILDLYRQVRRRLIRIPHDERDPVAAVLRISGIARVDRGDLVVRNRIYRHVFDRDWILAHMPDAEVRRQRKAFRRGFLLAALGSCLVVGTIGYGISARAQVRKISALRQRAERNEEEARDNAARALRESHRLKDVIKEVRNGLQNIMREIPAEAGKNPLFRLLPPQSQNTLLEAVLRRAIEHYDEMADRYGDVPLIRGSLAATYCDLGRIQQDGGKSAEAIESFQQAVDHQWKTCALAPHEAEFQAELNRYLVALAGANRAAGKLDEAAALADERAALWPDDPRALYTLACELSDCASRAGPESASAASYAARAVTMLRKAVAHGYNDARTLKADPALAPLRVRGDFHALLASVDRPPR